MDNKTKAFVIAARFFALALCAAENGGFWVSAAGGTANVVAGEISRALGVDFDTAARAVESIGAEILGESWYQALYDIQPPVEDWEEYRFDARTVARAACRPFYRPVKGWTHITT